MVFTKVLTLSQIKRLKSGVLVEILNEQDMTRGHKVLFEEKVRPKTSAEFRAYQERFTKLRLLKAWRNYRELVTKRELVVASLQKDAATFSAKKLPKLNEKSANRRIKRLAKIGATDSDEYKRIEKRLQQLQHGELVEDEEEDEFLQESKELSINSRLFNDDDVRNWVVHIHDHNHNEEDEIKASNVSREFVRHINWRLYEFVEAVMNTLPLAAVGTAKRTALNADCNQSVLSQATIERALRLANPRSQKLHAFLKPMPTPNRFVLMRAMRFYARPVFSISEEAYKAMEMALQEHCQEMLYQLMKYHKAHKIDKYTTCDAVSSLAGKVPRNPSSHVFSGTAENLVNFEVVDLGDSENDHSSDDDDDDDGDMQDDNDDMFVTANKDFGSVIEVSEEDDSSIDDSF